MRRVALLAVSQCFGIIAFCQSSFIVASQGQRTPPDTPASVDSLFNQFAKTPASTRLPDSSCSASSANQMQPAVSSEKNQLFHIPCMNPQLFALNAEDYMQLPTPPHSPWPQARSIPIPTQWPGAKPEPIPTTWPYLKLLPLAESKPDSTPAR